MKKSHASTLVPLFLCRVLCILSLWRCRRFLCPSTYTQWAIIYAEYKWWNHGIEHYNRFCVCVCINWMSKKFIVFRAIFFAVRLPIELSKSFWWCGSRMSYGIACDSGKKGNKYARRSMANRLMVFICDGINNRMRKCWVKKRTSDSIE